GVRRAGPAAPPAPVHRLQARRDPLSLPRRRRRGPPRPSHTPALPSPATSLHQPRHADALHQQRPPRRPALHLLCVAQQGCRHPRVQRLGNAAQRRPRR
ncbi:hypothetical protein BN1708_020234, partial [Verticillium longisporum]